MGKESHLGQIAKGSSLVGMSVMGYLALSRWLQTDTAESSQVVPTESSQAGLLQPAQYGLVMPMLAAEQPLYYRPVARHIQDTSLLNYPQGPEFQVNTYTTNTQQSSAIGALTDGGFVITWESSGQDGDGNGIYAQHYDAAGVAQGAEFQVNAYTTSNQQAPAIGALRDGGFVITWQSSGQDGSNWGIYAQRYDVVGVAQGTEFQVNTHTTNAQQFPAISALSDGGFVITWQSTGQDGDSWGIYAQRYDAAGVTQGAEFQVNTYTTSNQQAPAIAALRDGGLVITWQSAGQDGDSLGIYAQRYDAAGVAQSAEFQVNTYTTNDQQAPAIGALTDGGFVITWQSTGQDGDSLGIYAQRYDSNGVAQGTEFRVNTYTTSNQLFPAIGALTDGGFVITWQSTGQDGSGNGIYAQEYDGNGQPVNGEFQVNTYTANAQQNPAIGALTEGGFVITWVSTGQDGNSNGIYAQRYQPQPKALALLTNNSLPVGQGQTLVLNTQHFNGTDSEGAALMFMVSDVQHGRFSRVSAPTTAIAQFTQQELEDGQIQFVQNGSVNAPAFFISISNGRATERVMGGVQFNPAPTLNQNQLPVGQRQTVKLTSRLLQASDDSASAADIHFSVSNLLRCQFERVSQPGVAITAFTQQQINDGDVQFVHNGNPNPPQFELQLSDGQAIGPKSLGGVNFYPQKMTAKLDAELQVNTYTTSNQQSPAIAALSEGGFIITWQSAGQDGSTNGVYAQRYDAHGVAQGAEFQVNTYTTNAQQRPAVAALSEGGFVITWESNGQDGSGNGVYAQRYNAAGVAQGAEFQVNTYTTNAQSFPAIGALTEGGFVITWQSFVQDGSFNGIYAQRYDAHGVAQGAEFRVNTYTTNDQLYPAIGALSDGGFVITWGSGSQDGDSWGIYAQRYDANGVAQGAEFQVNTYTTGQQLNPSVSGLTGGGFVITWDDASGQDGDIFGIYAQRYDANGVAQGAEFQVNTYTTSSQSAPAVGALSEGGFIITWQSVGQDGSSNGIYAQRYDTNGVAQGAELQVNTYTINSQQSPAIGALTEGGFVITWESVGQDGDSTGIYAQRYDGTLYYAPVLQQQSFTVQQGEAIILNDALLSASDVLIDNSTLLFEVSEVEHGQFERLSAPGMAISNFTQQALLEGDVQFIHDGSTTAPSYQISVYNGYLRAVPEQPSIDFRLALQASMSMELSPQASSEERHISSPWLGQSPASSTVFPEPSASLSVIKSTVPFDSVSSQVAVSSRAEQASSTVFPEPSASLSVIKSTVPFDSVSSQVAVSSRAEQASSTVFPEPSASLSVTESTVPFDSTSSQASTLSSTAQGSVSPLVSSDAVAWQITVQLSVKQGQSLVLSPAQFQASRGSASPEQVVYTLSQVQHGRFELVGAPGQAITGFTQQQINDGQIRFVHDGSSQAPRFSVSVSDGQQPSPEQASEVDFTLKAGAHRKGAIIGGVVGGVGGACLVGGVCLGLATAGVFAATKKRDKAKDLPDLERGIEMNEATSNTL